ncbi:MAG: hypothetical protein Q7S22_04295 [Candidatus Micrarchaeota archaeon]|nr:hypothetical protein [Candidatus Micrarchaeota archaeon]
MLLRNTKLNPVPGIHFIELSRQRPVQRLLLIEQLRIAADEKPKSSEWQDRGIVQLHSGSFRVSELPGLISYRQVGTFGVSASIGESSQRFLVPLLGEIRTMAELQLRLNSIEHFPLEHLLREVESKVTKERSWHELKLKLNSFLGRYEKLTPEEAREFRDSIYAFLHRMVTELRVLTDDQEIYMTLAAMLRAAKGFSDRADHKTEVLDSLVWRLEHIHNFLRHSELFTCLTNSRNPNLEVAKRHFNFWLNSYDGYYLGSSNHNPARQDWEAFEDMCTERKSVME